MANPLHHIELPRSRRSLLKWLGQIAAGTAVAGLGILNPELARAAKPNTGCTGCSQISCTYDPTDCPDPYHQGYVYLVTYKQYYGAPPCKYSIMYACTTYQCNYC